MKIARLCFASLLQTSYRREARQSLLCPPPSKERGKMSQSKGVSLFALLAKCRVVYAFISTDDLRLAMYF